MMWCGGERILENKWCIREWMIIHSHETTPCFNKTNYTGVSQWQPMITHDPETEWVKITENWWKSGAKGQMALKQSTCDYYFLGLPSDRAWIYFLWKKNLSNCRHSMSAWKWLHLFLANGKWLTRQYRCGHQPHGKMHFQGDGSCGF